MKHTLIIDSSGKILRKRKSRMRENLPYMGIARRHLNVAISYDREIDISAVVIK